MDINEIKQVPIVDFLYILGIEPVKHKASGLWYHAPYRNDRNPSLRVSTDKNVWYDYGIARGGDIFNLAGEFINSNEFVAQAKFISETLGGSFPTSFPHYQRIAEKAVKAKGNPFSDIVEKPLSHPALRQYLRERGISADVASRFCCQVEYRYNGKQFFAVGFKNNSDGYEIRNRFFKGCVSPKDITLIGRNSNVCHLYEGFMDFLSAVILGIGRGEDHIVLNSVANTIVARTEESKFCFLDSCNVSVIMLALFYFVYTILVYFSVGKDRAFCVMLFLEMDFFFS